MSNRTESQYLATRITDKLMQEFLQGAPAFPYKRAKIKFDWKSSDRGVRKKIDYSYEDYLKNIFRSSSTNHEHYENRPIIILGGRGSGKSTSIMKILRDLEVEFEISYIHLDLNKYDERKYLDSEESKIQLRFASHLKQRIMAFNGSRLDASREIFEFFPWCLENEHQIHSSLDQVQPFSDFLARYDNEIIKNSKREPFGSMSPTELTEFLISELRKLKSEMNSVDLVWYQILQMIFQQGWSADRNDLAKRFLILDNIDHVQPELQRFSVSLFHSVTRCTGVQTIIPMRPHTHSTTRTSAGADHMEFHEHCSADVVEVIDKRLARALAEEDHAANRAFLKRLREVLISNDKHLRQIVEHSSGIDIRSALMNFTNFCERVLSAHGTGVEFHNLEQSEICRLYFLGESGSFNYSMSENLYFVRVGDRRIFCPVKVFILDHIMTSVEGAVQFGEMELYLKCCGFSEAEILAGFANLLHRARALIWSTDGFSVDEFHGKTELAITPMGSTYFLNLFGEFYYAEICMTDRTLDRPNMSEVIAFEKRFVQAEMKALINLMNSKEKKVHETLDVEPGNVIGVRHWRKFLHGAKFRVKNDRSGALDAKREEWLSKVYRAIIEREIRDISQIGKIEF